MRPNRNQDNKTARIPQNELLDLLYECFQEYKYWSLKALKARVRQPEAYLKDTLLKIATLVKSGSFAMRYALNPEAQMATYNNNDALPGEIAPEDIEGVDENLEVYGVEEGEDEEEEEEEEEEGGGGEEEEEKEEVENTVMEDIV